MQKIIIISELNDIYVLSLIKIIENSKEEDNYNIYSIGERKIKKYLHNETFFELDNIVPNFKNSLKIMMKNYNNCIITDNKKIFFYSKFIINFMKIVNSIQSIFYFIDKTIKLKDFSNNKIFYIDSNSNSELNDIELFLMKNLKYKFSTEKVSSTCFPLRKIGTKEKGINELIGYLPDKKEIVYFFENKLNIDKIIFFLKILIKIDNNYFVNIIFENENEKSNYSTTILNKLKYNEKDYITFNNIKKNDNYEEEISYIKKSFLILAFNNDDLVKKSYFSYQTSKPILFISKNNSSFVLNKETSFILNKINQKNITLLISNISDVNIYNSKIQKMSEIILNNNLILDNKKINNIIK